MIIVVDYIVFSRSRTNTFTLAFFYSFLFNEFNNKIKYLIFGYAVLVALVEFIWVFIIRLI